MPRSDWAASVSPAPPVFLPQLVTGLRRRGGAGPEEPECVEGRAGLGGASGGGAGGGRRLGSVASPEEEEGGRERRMAESGLLTEF